MNIVVFGAGRVGTSIADLLCKLEHCVTVVDIDPKRVAQINEELDVRAFVGSASQASVQFQAGVSTADICMAMTGVDEVNIVAASLAKGMGARRGIARVYAPVFRDLSTFDYQRHFGIDRMMSLEQLTAVELARNIRDPSSMVVDQFARGELEVQEFIVGQEGKVTREPVRKLGLPANVRIGTIQRENRMWIAAADDQMQIGDKVIVFCRPEDLKAVKTLFKTPTGVSKRVVIAGGGETSLHLARTLEREGYKVMIMEPDEDRCKVLAGLLESTTIINATARDIENLEEQRVGTADVFVACTGEDENNMMLGVKADDLGTQQVLAVISRPEYASLGSRLGIDVAVSARDVMAKQILSFLNDGFIVSRAKMPGGLINVIEVDVLENSRVTQSTLAELELPDRCLVIAVIQNEVVRVPGANDKLNPGDTAIVLVEEDVVNAAMAVFEPKV